MNWVQLGGSLAAVFALGGIAWLLRLGDQPITDVAAAMQAAEDALSGFEARDAIVGRDRAAALIFATDGRMAVLKSHGAHPAVREVRPQMLVATPAGIVVDSGERRFGRVTLNGVDALDVRRLAPSLTRV